MSLTWYQQHWIDTAVGRWTDEDGDNRADCVDVVKDYAQNIWAWTTWQEVWPQAGNAKDMLWNVNLDYVDRIVNDPNDPNQIPEAGDMVFFGGNSVNPYGHTGVVTQATIYAVELIQEDSFLNTPMQKTWLGYDNYGTGMVSGWLRPKFT